MRALNPGILAYVDAGETRLTERLLCNAGVIAPLGRVDDGNTHTDTLAPERHHHQIRRGVVPDRRVTVNLIDTPGHPDFTGGHGGPARTM